MSAECHECNKLWNWKCWKLCPMVACAFLTDVMNTKQSLLGNAWSTKCPWNLATIPTGFGARSHWLGMGSPKIWMSSHEIWTEISRYLEAISWNFDEISWDLDWNVMRSRGYITRFGLRSHEIFPKIMWGPPKDLFFSFFFFSPGVLWGY